MTSAQAVIDALQLTPLPVEGGYFRETYRASEQILGDALPARYPDNRALATAIYFLVTAEQFSALHALPTDELYFFHAGDPLEMLLLPPGEPSQVPCLGADVRSGQTPQLTVPRDVWQGSRPLPGGAHGFSLVSTTMAPGYEQSDPRFGERESLMATWPEAAELIKALTRLSPY